MLMMILLIYGDFGLICVCLHSVQCDIKHSFSAFVGQLERFKGFHFM